MGIVVSRGISHYGFYVRTQPNHSFALRSNDFRSIVTNKLMLYKHNNSVYIKTKWKPDIPSLFFIIFAAVTWLIMALGFGSIAINDVTVSELIKVFIFGFFYLIGFGVMGTIAIILVERSKLSKFIEKYLI